MNESENIGKPYSSPPPSYEEAVYGNQQQGAQIVHPPVIETPIYPSPQSQPSVQVTNITQSQNNRRQERPHNPIPQPYSIPLYNVCPPGTEVIRDLNEILVYPRSGWSQVHKIRDHNKVTILHAKLEFGDYCDSCCESTSTFELYSLEERLIAEATCFIDSVNCCSANEQHLEVIRSPDIEIGKVWIKDESNSSVVNQSGDLLFSLTHKQSQWNNNPHEIFSADGTKIGEVDNSRGRKNRLKLPKEMPVQHKILLLFFAIHRQSTEDGEKRKRHS